MRQSLARDYRTPDHLMPHAPVTAASTPPIDYYAWRTRTVALGGRSFAVATKPGLIGHGHDDVAARLLAQRVVVRPGAIVVHMQCGNGLFGAVASLAHGASTVYLTDRNAVGLEAAIRTLRENGVSNAQVLSGHGSAPLDPALRADVVAFRIPTDKLALRQLLADAFGLLTLGGQCCIAGATNEGIKSAATLLEAVFGNATVLATDSGSRAVMAVKRAATPMDPAILDSPLLAHDTFRSLDVVLRGTPMTLFSRPGVFSSEHLDEGTQVLADVLVVREGDSVLDLGCGSGALGLLAARLSGTGRVTMVDVDSEAVRCTRRAIDASGAGNCRALISDVALAVRDERFDVVVANPPFHVGKQTDLAVPMQFIRDAHSLLKPGGRLQLVANRTLPYERLVQELFGNLQTIHDGPRFKVLAATR